MIALDNLVTTSESSMPPQLYRYDRFVAATVSAGLAKRKTISEGLAEMDRIAADVLDDNFKTTFPVVRRILWKFVQSDVCFCIGIDIHLPGFIGSVREFPDPPDHHVYCAFGVDRGDGVLVVFRSDYEYFQPDRCNHVDRAGVEERYSDCRVANQRKAMGEPMLIAVKNAAVARFRPILMTSLSTVLGILPMAIATGAGAESRVAMGIAVVGGMVCATFLSLFVIPAIYSYLSTEKVNVIGEEHKE